MTETIPAEDPREVIASHAQLFDTDQQAVIATTREGEVVYWNGAAERIYGWSENEVLGRDIVEITPSQLSRDTATEIMRQLRAGRSWSGEFSVVHKDGEEFLVQVRDLPVRDSRGELVGIVGISTPAGPNRS